MQCFGSSLFTPFLYCCALPHSKPQVLVEVNEDARAMLDQVLKLLKKAGKAKQRVISDALLTSASKESKGSERGAAAME